MNQTAFDFLPHEEETLAQARAEWDVAIHDRGGACPCCGRFGKIYERQFNSTMSRSLIWLAHCPEHDGWGWINVPKVAPKSIVRTNQLPTVRWWGLIERMPNNDNPKIKHSGRWRITSMGREFVSNSVSIPRSVSTYAGEPTHFSSAMVKIKDTFATDFDYEQVMTAAARDNQQPSPGRGRFNDYSA